MRLLSALRLAPLAPAQPLRLVFPPIGFADVDPVEAPRAAHDHVFADVPFVLVPEPADRQAGGAVDVQRQDLAQHEVADAPPRGVAVLEHALHERVDLVPGLRRARRGVLDAGGGNGLPGGGVRHERHRRREHRAGGRESASNEALHRSCGASPCPALRRRLGRDGTNGGSRDAARGCEACHGDSSITSASSRGRSAGHYSLVL